MNKRNTQRLQSIQGIQSMHLAVPAATQQRKGAHIVIVGNGIAGLTAAIAARRAAPHKGIIIVTEQSHPTINTPALKQFAIGKLGREQLLAYPLATERNNNIHLVHGRVEEIQARDRYIRLSHGGILDYGDLLLATGSTANGLPYDVPGRDFDGVLVLHRLQDYLSLRRRLHEVEDVVVIGGGVHAAETVMCMVQLGLQTHWLMRGKTFLSRMFDAVASARMIQHIQQQGVTVYTETEVTGIVGSVGVVAGVVTNEQQMIACQLVLVCTGSSPNTTLANYCTQSIQHEPGRGILVNDQLRTSVPGIYAAGDVAALKNPQTSMHETRAQWYAAAVQGHSAAATMTGTALEVPFFGVPWHATRIGDLSMLMVGNTVSPVPGVQVYSDTSKGSYRRLAVSNDRLVGYLSLGPTQPDGLAIKRIVDEEISLRNVGESLLKGTFDAHHFSAERHTQVIKAIRTVHTPAPGTSGKLPAIKPTVLALPSLPAAHSQEHSRSLWTYNRQRGQFLQEKGS
ncbi:MAG TPA: FAD/NAD(P)-binding oxidoreductase [Ktedonobacteraceae bacterium]|nr:FAD/NAD(P)-binding oxidoreductase [Ktedonobacteraceae bacterium]